MFTLGMKRGKKKRRILFPQREEDAFADQVPDLRRVMGIGIHRPGVMAANHRVQVIARSMSDWVSRKVGLPASRHQRPDTNHEMPERIVEYKGRMPISWVSRCAIDVKENAFLRQRRVVIAFVDNRIAKTPGKCPGIIWRISPTGCKRVPTSLDASGRFRPDDVYRGIHQEIGKSTVRLKMAGHFYRFDIATFSMRNSTLRIRVWQL